MSKTVPGSERGGPGQLDPPSPPPPIPGPSSGSKPWPAVRGLSGMGGKSPMRVRGTHLRSPTCHAPALPPLFQPLLRGSRQALPWAGNLPALISPFALLRIQPLSLNWTLPSGFKHFQAFSTLREREREKKREKGPSPPPVSFQCHPAAWLFSAELPEATVAPIPVPLSGCEWLLPRLPGHRCCKSHGCLQALEPLRSLLVTSLLLRGSLAPSCLLPSCTPCPLIPITRPFMPAGPPRWVLSPPSNLFSSKPTTLTTFSNTRFLLQLRPALHTLPLRLHRRAIASPRSPGCPKVTLRST